MMWKGVLKHDVSKAIDEKEVRSEFYPIGKGKCPKCGEEAELLETDAVLTGGKRIKMCKKCLDAAIKRYTEKYD
jgi:hypothetical protein